jgi:NAD(P)-dependent dehydrogenase (short-subunit alcohol dehydrogenase family)
MRHTETVWGEVMRLANKVSLITGAGAGMGYAAAHMFAREGSAIAVVDVDETTGNAAAESVRAAGGDAAFFHCDITEPASVEAMMTGVVQRFGKLDVLYNNAGSSHGVFGPLHTLDLDRWERVMRTNIRGTFLCNKYGIPHMLANGRGSVINVASAVGLVGWAGGAALCTAKGGIVLMTRAMALDYAGENIRVNCLCPGSTRTAQTDKRLKDAADPDAVIAPLVAPQAMKRLADPEEITAAALFLASDESTFVTGIAFAVDAGWTAM